MVVCGKCTPMKYSCCSTFCAIYAHLLWMLMVEKQAPLLLLSSYVYVYFTSLSPVNYYSASDFLNLEFCFFGAPALYIFIFCIFFVRSVIASSNQFQVVEGKLKSARICIQRTIHFRAFVAFFFNILIHALISVNFVVRLTILTKIKHLKNFLFLLKIF